MVSLVVENAELAGGYSVDWCLGVDDERSLGGLLQIAGLGLKKTIKRPTKAGQSYLLVK